MMKHLPPIITAMLVWAAPLAAMAQEEAPVGAGSPDLGWALAKTAGGLALVLALLFGLLWLLRRLSPAAAGTGSSQFRMVGKLSLGPRKWLGLVELGGRILVIGVSEAGIRHIETIDDPELLKDLATPKQGFSKVLQKARGATVDGGQ